MYLKSKEIFFIVGIISIIVVFLAFCPIEITFIDNQTMFKTFFNLKFADGGVFAAFAVGIITVLVSGYFNVKNYKSLKLTSIPKNSANLLIDLEYIFNEYEINQKEDVFSLLLQILRYWKEHQKVFRLLTPNFYKKFLKIWSKAKKINKNENIVEKNSKIILNAIIIQLSDMALTNEHKPFSFVNPNLITDEEDIKYLNKEPYEVDISKKNFLDYIDNISGKKTKKETKNKFLRLDKELNTLLKELKRELEEYD